MEMFGPCIFSLVALGTEPRALGTLGKRSATELHLQPWVMFLTHNHKLSFYWYCWILDYIFIILFKFTYRVFNSLFFGSTQVFELRYSAT
jgi:hypothetical protein